MPARMFSDAYAVDRIAVAEQRGDEREIRLWSALLKVPAGERERIWDGAFSVSCGYRAFRGRGVPGPTRSDPARFVVEVEERVTRYLTDPPAEVRVPRPRYGKCACGRGAVIGVIPGPAGGRPVCQECYQEACREYAARQEQWSQQAQGFLERYGVEVPK